MRKSVESLHLMGSLITAVGKIGNIGQTRRKKTNTSFLIAYERVGVYVCVSVKRAARMSDIYSCVRFVRSCSLVSFILNFCVVQTSNVQSFDCEFYTCVVPYFNYQFRISVRIYIRTKELGYFTWLEFRNTVHQHVRLVICCESPTRISRSKRNCGKFKSTI